MLYNNNRGDNMKYTEERKTSVNILFFIISILGLFILPSVFYTFMRTYFDDSLTLQFLSELFVIFVLFLIYYKDLKREFKIYIKNFKKNFSIMLKYYVLGIIIMIMSNLLINMIIGNVSANESSVRDSLFAFPVYTMLSIMIVAPLSEELVFRKSISPLIKNKWIYAIVCGLLFGGAHLLAGKFKLINLLYLIPYGSLGFVFALMNRETKTTFSSITMHCIHNTATGILLLVTYSMGVL